VPLEGEEVAERPGDQRCQQSRARHRVLGADRGAGLDERHHVAVEADVEHGVAVEPAHLRPAVLRCVGHEPHD
jgi:hypothetical protein